MKKKLPEEKNISTGVSLPPDLYAWLMSRVSAPSLDPTSSRSASRIVQQALIEYRARIEREEATDGPHEPQAGKAASTMKKTPAAPSSVGAGTINLSASSATLSSTAGKDRYRRAG